MSDTTQVPVNRSGQSLVPLPDIAASLGTLRQLSDAVFAERRSVWNRRHAQRRRLAQALRSLSQPLADSSKPYLAEEAARAMRQVMAGQVGEAASTLRFLEFELGLRRVNSLDHANAGLIASIFLLPAVTLGLFPWLGMPADLAWAMLGGGVGNLCYVTLQLIPDRTHKRGPEDVLHVLWRTFGASLLGTVVYGLSVSHLVRLPLEGDTANWGLFAISAMSGFAGKLITDIAAAIKEFGRNA